ncbi:MAG: DUF6544 family protein [Vicinamibacterales bacterium]
MSVMVITFAILLVVHGLIHLLGAAKGLGAAELPQLTQPISPVLGMGWLATALLFLASAVSLFVWPRWWWAVALCAVVASMAVIIPSWTDAKFGALANVIVLAGAGFGFLSQGPFSLRAEYDVDVQDRVSVAAPASPITEEDLTYLPPSVRRYLQVVGVVGQPRVRNFRVRMHGRIRDGRQGRWMSFTAEQYNVVEPAARLFYLNATMFAIPVQGYHRYVGSAASMRVKAAAVVPVATAAGAEMTQAETVTLFNDMCIMAPGTLIDPGIEWEPVDAHTASARFTNAGHTIRAVLTFNDEGELVDFVSDDRMQTSSDGTVVRHLRWSTPVRDYRRYGPVRLASGGRVGGTMPTAPTRTSN